MSPSRIRPSAPRRAALALALAACAAAALAPASVASGPSEDAASETARHQARSVHVTGEFIPVDDVGTYRLTGSLRGTWYTLTADTYYQSKAMIIQKGLERFEGCLDLNHNKHCDRNRKGKFSMDYMYWATFNPQSGRLVKGECIHPITAGKGVFSGTRGFINVNDKPVGKDGVVSTYEGELVLNAVRTEHAVVSNAPAALSAAASVATC